MFNNPSHIFARRCLLAFVGISLLAVSGCLKADSLESVIADMVKGAEADRAKNIAESNGIYSDYQAFKDPANLNTIILETTLTRGAEPKAPVDTEMLKQNTIDVFRAEGDLVKVVQMGVNITNRFKTADGKVYFEYTLTKKDLQ